MRAGWCESWKIRLAVLLPAVGFDRDRVGGGKVNPCLPRPDGE